MIADVLAMVLMAVGLFFMAVAAIGFARFPDVFCRLHVTGVIDTLGAPLILLATALYLGVTLSSGKLILAVVFLYVTSPLVGHLLARAAVEAGYRPVLEEVPDRHRARHYRADGGQAPAGGKPEAEGPMQFSTPGASGGGEP